MNFTKKTDGFTLIELLIGIAIIGAGIIAIVGVSLKSSETSKIQTEVKNIRVIKQTLITSFSNGGSYSTLNNAIAIKSGAFPTHMINGSNVRNSWGEFVLVQGNVDPSFFDIIYQRLTTSSCVQFTNLAISDFYQVKINNTAKFSRDWSPATVADACATSEFNDVTFTDR